MRWTLAAALTLIPTIASAHIALVFPPPRTTSLKTAVCGASGSTRGTNVSTFAPGSTITVMWKETIDHPGHYRIAFDDDGQDFPIPPDATGTTMGMPTVMIDLIADIQGNNPAGGRTYTQDITFPNIECSNCTLQVIQLMTDKPPYTTDALSNDIYYQCADITLSANAPDAGVPTDGAMSGGDAATEPATGGSGGGCSAGSGAGLMAALGLVGLRRRRSAAR